VIVICKWKTKAEISSSSSSSFYQIIKIMGKLFNAWSSSRREGDIPYFEGLLILSLSEPWKSKFEYLNPFSCPISSSKALVSALLCSLASTVSSSTQPRVLFCRTALAYGKQPIGSTFRNPNFLPPFLYISWIRHRILPINCLIRENKEIFNTRHY